MSTPHAEEVLSVHLRVPSPAPYSGKVWWGESLANWASRSFGEGKFGEY